MRKLSSFESLTTRVKVGSQVELTIDLFTAVGVLVLINSDKAQLEKGVDFTPFAQALVPYSQVEKNFLIFLLKQELLARGAVEDDLEGLAVKKLVKMLKMDEKLRSKDANRDKCFEPLTDLREKVRDYEISSRSRGT